MRMKRKRVLLGPTEIFQPPLRAAANISRDPVRSPGTLVVISYYDARPMNDLLRILRTIEEYDAGQEFNLCIVINQESGRKVVLPELPFPVTVLSRPNSGMNIGAWDYGWRENPGYEQYVFLQDECVILRHGWLRGLTQRLREPGVGVVGECINHRWSKTWADLTGKESNGSQQHDRVALIAKRAKSCLEFMQARGIPAGATAHHVRSLIWAFSKDVLQQLNGLPIGQDYEECIAAEVSVSRKIASLGLSVDQAYRTPFYFVGHTQWINTYPGLCASLEYGSWARKHFPGASFPFLSHVGKGDATSRLDQLVKRVETERGLFEGGVLQAPRCGFLAVLVVFIDRAPLDPDLASTALSWCMQSAPYIDMVFVATDKFLLNKVKAWMSKSNYEDFSKIRVCPLAEWSAETLEEYEFVLFARPGDQFHPSVVSVLTVLDAAEQPDVVAWTEQRGRCPDQGAWLFRQPRFEPFTIQSVGYVGMAFAVRPNLIRAFPYDFVDDLLNNDSHLFHVWIAQDSRYRWTTHPEVLSSRPLRTNNPHEVSRFGYEGYRSHYKEILNANSEVDVLPSKNGHCRSPLIPIRRATSVSVIVSFRDKPQETIACLRSLLGQHTAGHIEVILINNRSSEGCLAEVRQSVELARTEGADIKLVNYDGPFNHSRQTNLGIRLSSGEVVVFLNNDA